jgi:hypothetical protein
MEENTSKVYREPANGLLRQQPGAGAPLFVINLCASMAPMEITGKTLPGFESYRLYTVARVEDGRTRYRLRMGFFTSQAAAEDVVGMLRKQYATAFAACLSDEDRRFTRGYVPDPSNTARARVRPAVAVVPQAPPQQAAPQATTRAATPASSPAKAAPATQARAAANVPAAPVARSANPSSPVRAAAPATAAKPAPARPAVNAPQARSVDSSGSGVYETTWEPESPRTGATGSFKVGAGSFNPGATGSFKVAAGSPHPGASGSFKVPPGSFNPGASGAFKVPAGSFNPGASGSFKVPAGSFDPGASGSYKIAAGAVNPGATGKFKAGTGSFKALDQNSINEIELSWERSGLKLPPSPPVNATQAPAPKAPAAATRQAAAPVAAPKVAPTLKAQPAVQARPAAKAAPPVVKAPAKAAVPEVKHPPVTVKPSAPVRLELEAAHIAPRQAAPAAPGNQPFHVGKGVNIPQVSLSLQQESAAVRQAQAAAKQTDETSTRLPKLTPGGAPANKMAGAQSKAMQPAGAAQLPSRIAASPDLDSTQTIRALTDAEMNDANQEKWWAIQLAVSDQPLNLDAMPHLDIFEAYRLYSVASAGSGKIVHSLRLGFFREAVSAEAVSGYLKTFFPTPSILRISSAEQARFKDAPAPKAAAAPKNESKVIDLNGARDRTKPVPMVTMEVGKADRSPTGSYKVGAAAAKNGGSGIYKALNPAVLKPAQAPAVKQPLARQPVKVASKYSVAKPAAGAPPGKFRVQSKLSLQDQLLDEAREVQLSESGVRRQPKNDSLLSRLVDKLTK